MVYIFYVSTCANITPTPEVVEKKKNQAASRPKKRAVKENSHSASTHSDFFCQVRSSSRGEDLRDQRLGACPGT